MTSPLELIGLVQLASPAGIDNLWCKKKFSQRDRVVMCFVMRGIHERDGALARQCAQGIEQLRVWAQFGRIALVKRLPARGVVTEPLAQLGAGRELLGPLIHGQTLLLDAPRPQAVNQYPRTVVVGWRVVGTLDPDMAGWNFCAHESALAAVWLWLSATGRCGRRCGLDRGPSQAARRLEMMMFGDFMVLLPIKVTKAKRWHVCPVRISNCQTKKNTRSARHDCPEGVFDIPFMMSVCQTGSNCQHTETA